MNNNIYIILYTLSLGGAERHASSIANYLSDKGFSVSIILLQNSIVSYPLNENVKVISFADMSFPQGTVTPNIKEKIRLKLSKKLLSDHFEKLDKWIYINNLYTKKLSYFFGQQPDTENSTVISFMTIPNICSSDLKTKFAYKLILAEFTSPQYEFPADAPENTFKKQYYKNADGFIFQTDEQKEFYSFLPNVKKSVIPNPIENIAVEPFHGVRKKEIVNYCKHVKAKNLPLLIKAFAKLSAEYPDYSLVIYGDGPTKSETEKCITDCGVEGKVILKPFAADVLEKVRESTMFVSSSDREGISNSMLEAMAIGLPTICTDCPAGGPRMFIKPYENGITVPVGDVDALYKAMKYVIDHPEEAAKMATKATEIKTTLEKSKILDQWLDFIRSI